MSPRMTILNLPALLKTAQQLPLQGMTKVTASNLFCLRIDDAFIHQLFPLLADERIKKPDYFGEKATGAHISIIYPEENKTIALHDLQQIHHFSVKEIATAEIGTKTYYVIWVESASLLQLRKKYQLPELLNFRGYAVGFHITIGKIQKL